MPRDDSFLTILIKNVSAISPMEVKEQSTAITGAPITTIAQIGTREGQTVTIRGWLYNLRESGKLLFPIFLGQCRDAARENGTASARQTRWRA